MKKKKMEYYRTAVFEKDVGIMVKIIKQYLIIGRGLKFKNIYGPKRGGWCPVVWLSHRLNLPVISNKKEIGPDTLIADDIVDTGKTLYKYHRRGNIIVAFFYCRWSKFVPDIWLREKKSKKEWIHFPWEA